MTSGFVKSKSADYFMGKRAVLNDTLTNLGGQSIEGGTEVTIVQKSADGISLDIKCDAGVNMNNVWCGHIELVKDRK